MRAIHLTNTGVPRLQYKTATAGVVAKLETSGLDNLLRSFPSASSEREP